MTSPDIILSQFGYIYTGSCRCDGFFTEKYRKPGTGFQIRWRTSKMTFKVKQHGNTYYTWKNISKLENVLDELATQIIHAQTKV